MGLCSSNTCRQVKQAVFGASEKGKVLFIIITSDDMITYNCDKIKRTGEMRKRELMKMGYALMKTLAALVNEDVRFAH